MKLFTFFLLSPIFLFSQTQIGYDIDGLVAGDHAGYSVSISTDGSIVAVGSPDNGNEKGQVRVFENISNNWIQIGEDIEGEQIGDQLGSSISLSGDGSIVAIGAPYNDNIETDAGTVLVFENISGTWTQLGDDINGEDIENRLGLFVSLSGDGSKLAISGYWCCGLYHGTPGVGKTWIYENIDDEWYAISEEINTGFNGISDIDLSADGSVVAIASSGSGSPPWSGFYQGGVVVYKNITPGIWTQIGDPFLREVYWSYYDFFGGVSLTNDGSRIAIGGNAASIYENIEDDWVQLGEDIETSSYRPKMSLSNNGNLLVIGAETSRIYENNSGIWMQLGIDINEEASDDVLFDHALELSGDGTTLIVGAPNNDGNGTDAGHARVYDLSAFLSSDEFILTQFSLFPNPTSNQFEIKLNSHLKLLSVNIYNNLGQFLQRSKTSTVQTANLASGLYYVEVITNQGKATKKLVIK